jgi:hypothetical protein
VYHEHHSELHLILGTAYLLACKWACCALLLPKSAPH